MAYMKNLVKNKKNLLNKVSPISYNDIRRIREPFVALIKEQVEDGYSKTATFLEELFAKVNNLKNATHSNEIHAILLKAIPLLRQLEEIVYLVSSITPTEQLNKLREICSNFHQIIDGFWLLGAECLPFCERILLLLLNVAQKLRIEDDEVLTNIHYQIAHFYHNTEDYEKACNHFAEANILSQNKDYLMLDEGGSLNLNQLVCVEFCSALMGAASQHTDLGQTKRLAIQSIEMAEQSNDQNAIGEAHYFLGGLQQKIQQFELSCCEFSQSIRYFETSLNTRRQCAAHLNLARSLNYLNRHEECINNIETMLKIAQKFNHPHELARAHELLADVYEKCQRFSVAVAEYNTAVEIYIKLGMRCEATTARCSGANCLAKVLIHNMADMRIKMDREELGNSIHMAKMTRWKDNRELYEDEDISGHDGTKSTELLQSISTVRAQNRNIL